MEPLINTHLIVAPLVETMKTGNAKTKSKLKEKQRQGGKKGVKAIIIDNKDVSLILTLSLSLSLGEQRPGTKALWTGLPFSSTVNYPVLHVILHY